MIKSVASLVIGFNLFFTGILGFMIFYSTAQSVSQLAATEIPDLPKLIDDTIALNGTEYSVKKVTVALNITKFDEEKSRYIWFEGGVEQMNTVLKQPVSTLWVDKDNWIIGTRYQLTNWTDNGDGELSRYDNIALVDITKSEKSDYTVEEVATYIFVNLVDWRLYLHLYAEPPRLINASDPVGTEWVELYPNFGRGYHLTSWEDKNKDGLLSPSDIPEISMAAWSSSAIDRKWGTPDDSYMPTIFTPEMKRFLDNLSADFDPLTEEILGLTEDAQTMAEEMSLLSYLLLGMAVLGVVLMLYGTYKGFKIEKEPA